MSCAFSSVPPRRHLLDSCQRAHRKRPAASLGFRRGPEPVSTGTISTGSSWSVCSELEGHGHRLFPGRIREELRCRSHVPARLKGRRTGEHAGDLHGHTRVCTRTHTDTCTPRHQRSGLPVHLVLATSNFPFSRKTTKAETMFCQSAESARKGALGVRISKALGRFRLHWLLVAESPVQSLSPISQPPDVSSHTVAERAG